MQLMRKYSRCSIFLLIGIFWVMIAPAQTIGGQVRALGILDGSLHQIHKDSSVTVQDSAFFNPANAGKIDTSYGVQNQVTLMINEASTLYLRTAFSVTATLRISYTDAKGDTASIIRNFTVGYDSAHTYNSRSSFVFNGAHQVTVKVLSDSSNVATWDPTSVLLIENQLTATPRFLFSCSNTVTNITVSPSSDPTADELPVSWNPVQGANQYDLEWTWIDSSALDTTQGIRRFGSPYNPTLIFRNSGTRISTTGTSYSIPIIYDNTGTLFIRVRPVQLGNGYSVTNAIWSSDAATSVMGQFTFRGHERPLNWQSNISFAEEGKRKVVLQYYDGSLRSRQTVTKDNTTNTTIVGETYYDYQGRPAVQVMPSPTLNTIIKYTAGFNVSFNSAEYSQSNYDTLPNPAQFCSIHADSMSSDSGASRYYSPHNPQASVGLNQFIPDAHDYPFTETEYTPDNTGRINRQGGVGPYHQLGTGHETKYFYGSPDQNELDALFGTEVGDKSHYFKNMVRDANGQYSVSYVDMHGRTIATALAGHPPMSMAPLPSNNSNTLTETLADSNSVSIQGLSMVSQKSLLVPMADTFYFNYNFTPDIFNDLNCSAQNICYTCRYDLDITITDNCNNQLLGGQPFTISRQNFSLASLRNSCVDTAMNLSFFLLLPEGSYVVTKKLTVDQDVFNFYQDSIYLPNKTCTTIGQFISQQKAIAESANTQCSPTCASCLSGIGSFSAFLANYNQQIGLTSTDTTYQKDANAAYQSAIAACSSLCQMTTDANDIQSAMLQDMSPPYGQYADSVLAANSDKYSIFYIPPSDSADYVPLFKLPQVVYTDVNGKADSVYDAQSGLMVDPNSLTMAEFVQNFRPSWADALLPYHPEYCKLQVMLAHNSSLVWDRKMESIDTYQQALDSGFLNPTGISSLSAQFPIDSYNIDPLSATLGSQLNTQLQGYQQLKNPNVLLSMWGLASAMVKCDSGDAACFVSYGTIGNAFASQWCDGDRDMAWKNFRELYLGAKQETFYQNLLSDNAMTQSGVCTPNNSRAYSTEPKLSQLYSANHQPHFSDIAQSMSNSSLQNNLSVQSSGQASSLMAQSQATLDSLYTANCKAFSNEWMQQLSVCTVYNPADVSNIIIPGLIALCRQACDSDHPYGASTLPPGQTIIVAGQTCTSFQDIINHYNLANHITDLLHCNAEVITSPLPYGNQPVYSNKPVYTRPSDCECGLINSLYAQYTLSTFGDASFSAFLLRTQQITMSDADLTTLRTMCSTAANSLTCKNLSTPIYLPPIMQCYAGPGCARCQTIDSLFTVYKQQYPSDTPSITSSADTAQAQKNILFQNFMNNRLGFNLLTWQYLQFMDTCAAHSADTVTTIVGNLPTTVVSLFDSISNVTFANISRCPDGSGFAAGWYYPGHLSANSSIIHFNSTGNIQWQKSYTNAIGSSTSFTSIKATSDGGFIAIGYYIPPQQEGYQVVVLKGDAAGNSLWQKTIGFQGALGWRTTDIIQTHDGGYAFVADWNDRINSSYLPLDLAVKMNNTGTVTWAKGFCDSSGFQNNANYIAEIGGTLVVTGSQSTSSEPNNRLGLFFKMDEYTGAILGTTFIVDTALQDTVSSSCNLQQVYSTATGYQVRIGAESNFGVSRSGVLNLDFSGAVLQYREFGLPPGNSETSDGYSIGATPTLDGGWMVGETAPASANIYWTKFNSDNTTGWSTRTNLPGAQSVGDIIQNPDSSFTVLGKDGSAYMLLNLSSSGTTVCYDSVVSGIPIKNLYYITNYHNLKGLIDSTLSWTYFGDTIMGTQVTSNLSTISCGGNYYVNYNGPLLCGKAAPLLPPVMDTITACTDSTFFSVTSGTALFNTYSDSLTGTFQQQYLNTCMQAYKHERFTVTHTRSEYHYTLYYYDQAGNLLKTVPPAGVQQNTDTNWLKLVRAARAAGTVLVPSHTLATNYRYNTLNQVVAQHSPDGGTSNFWYDRLGRLALSQNGRQQPNNQYSYTQYDTIGRITQVGQLVSGTAISDAISRTEFTLLQWELNAASTADQITVTNYDLGSFAIFPELGQRNLRNRVGWTALYNTAADLTASPANQAAATYFSYDILGNVDTLVQDYKIGSMANNSNRFKKIAYDFDLVSGKVNQVTYQHGSADAFFHSYLYDAENRITNVQSSTDSVNWDNDAFYSYYAHGLLARTVLGQQQVQGINYAYTLQGWLKAINPAPDTIGAFTLRPDSSRNIVANTAYNLLLNYFNGDYNPISTVAGPDSAVSTTLGADYRPLFNGNISSMGVNIRKINNPLLYNYQYDQLNRLIHMDAWNRTATPWSAITKVPDFQESIAYDPNGNIQKYKRNGNNTFAGQPIGMDSLNYFYTSGTNKLDHIADSVPSGNYTTDIDGQSSGNYNYDSIGELISDAASNISSITWTVYGKIASITKSGDTTLLFTYDPGGNRISKSVVHAGDTLTTWYVRDAQGNVMSVYTYGDPAVNGKDLSQTELHVYGSSRLGIWNRSVNVEVLPPVPSSSIPLLGTGDSLIFTRGNKLFELSNHLGNVLATISDKRYGVSPNDSTVTYFNPEIVSANDYYPFGSLQPGRSYMESNSGNYRYGFNGKEKDDEVKGVGDQQDYGMRVYDPRVGRFLSVDPMTSVYPWYSPYQFAGNNPVRFIDLDGDEPSEPGKKAGDVQTGTNGNGGAKSWKWDGKKWQENELASAVVIGRKATNDEKKAIKNSTIPFSNNSWLVRHNDVSFAGIFREFKNSTGPVNSVFLGNHPLTKEVRENTKEVDRLRFLAYKKYRGHFPANGSYTNFSAYGGSFLPWDDNYSEAPQFVGTFSGDVFVSEDGKKLVFVITDSKSATSLFYRMVDAHDRVWNDQSFYSNTFQKYIWTEPIDDQYYNREKASRDGKGNIIVPFRIPN